MFYFEYQILFVPYFFLSTRAPKAVAEPCGVAWWAQHTACWGGWAWGTQDMGLPLSALSLL